MSLTSCQTQRHRVQLRVEPKHALLWRAMRCRVLGFNYALSLSTYEFDELQDVASLGSAAIESKYTWV
jgi:hypothetical protein